MSYYVPMMIPDAAPRAPPRGDGSAAIQPFPWRGVEVLWADSGADGEVGALARSCDAMSVAATPPPDAPVASSAPGGAESSPDTPGAGNRRSAQLVLTSAHAYVRRHRRIMRAMTDAPRIPPARVTTPCVLRVIDPRSPACANGPALVRLLAAVCECCILLYRRAGTYSSAAEACVLAETRRADACRDREAAAYWRGINAERLHPLHLDTRLDPAVAFWDGWVRAWERVVWIFVPSVLHYEAPEWQMYEVGGGMYGHVGTSLCVVTGGGMLSSDVTEELHDVVAGRCADSGVRATLLECDGIDGAEGESCTCTFEALLRTYARTEGSRVDLAREFIALPASARADADTWAALMSLATPAHVREFSDIARAANVGADTLAWADAIGALGVAQQHAASVWMSARQRIIAQLPVHGDLVVQPFRVNVETVCPAMHHAGASRFEIGDYLYTAMKRLADGEVYLRDAYGSVAHLFNAINLPMQRVSVSAPDGDDAPPEVLAARAALATQEKALRLVMARLSEMFMHTLSAHPSVHSAPATAVIHTATDVAYANLMGVAPLVMRAFLGCQVRIRTVFAADVSPVAAEQGVTPADLMQTVLAADVGDAKNLSIARALPRGVQLSSGSSMTYAPAGLATASSDYADVAGDDTKEWGFIIATCPKDGPETQIPAHLAPEGVSTDMNTSVLWIARPGEPAGTSLPAGSNMPMGFAVGSEDEDNV